MALPRPNDGLREARARNVVANKPTFVEHVEEIFRNSSLPSLPDPLSDVRPPSPRRQKPGVRLLHRRLEFPFAACVQAPAMNSPSMPAVVSDPQPPPDSIDREIRAAHDRRARVKWLIATLFALAVVGGTALWWTTRSRLPDPPQKTLESVRAAMPQIRTMRPEVRVAFAGRALADLDVDRLPPKLRDAFGDLETVPPFEMQLVAMRALSDPAVAALWTNACPAGAHALAEATSLPPLEAAHRLYEACDFARFGFLSLREVEGTNASLLALAYTAYAELKSKRALLTEEESLLRVLVVSSQ